MDFRRHGGWLCALALGACAAPDSEIHLAPFYSRHTVPDYQHAEGLGGIVRYHREADIEEWALSPLLWRKVDGHGNVHASFLGGLGAYEYDPDRERSYSRLFPLWSYRDEIRVDGIRDRDWSAFFWLLAGGSSSDGIEDYFWFFPFFGSGRDFWTYDEFRFLLFPLYFENHKEDRHSYHWLWPFFGRTEGSEQGWHLWPLYGTAQADRLYRRSYILWPLWHQAEDELYKPKPRHSWMLFPLIGRVEQDDYRATTLLPPFFGRAERPSTGYSAWQFWPLVKFESGGRDEDRRLQRLLPFWLHYEDDKTSYTSVLFPFFWKRHDRFHQMERNAHYFVPFFLYSKTQRDDGRLEHNLRLWPIFSREWTSRGENRTRFLDLGLPRVLDPETLSRSFGFLYEFWKSQRRIDPGPVVVQERRAWLNLYHSTEGGGHSRWSVPFLGGQWTEPDGTRHSSWLFGLLRWRSGDNGGLQNPAFPGPGWPDLHRLVDSEE